MDGQNLDGLIGELEETGHRKEFFGKLEDFNETFIERFKKTKEDVEDKGNFPFGTVVPQGPLVRTTGGIHVIERVIYVPYFPPRAKEVYPFEEKEVKDLEYWKDKREEYSRFLAGL